MTETLACTVYVEEGEDGLERRFTRVWNDEEQRDELGHVYLPVTRQTRGVAACPAHSSWYRDEETIMQRAVAAEEIRTVLAMATEQAYILEMWQNRVRGIWSTLLDLNQVYIFA